MSNRLLGLVEPAGWGEVDGGPRQVSRRVYTRIKWALPIIILACVALLVLTTPSWGLMGGEGLMWSVVQDAPVKLVVCWENPSAADPLPGESATASGATRRSSLFFNVNSLL